MAKQNKPAIRFKGFTDAWEQRKFSDITFPAGEKNKENLPLESYSITNESGFVPQDEKFENGGTMREADKRMYYIVSPNSFAYNPARINVGSIGYQDTGKSVIVSSLYEVFKTSDDVDDRLLWHWFKSPDFQKLIMQLQEGGVRLYFYYDKLCMGQVFLPSLEEQRKIGKLFDTLDHLITLHQRKYDKLQVLKKAMLEKMFPKNGSSVPEIRFKGFTDAWEQRKFSDLYAPLVERNSDLLPYNKTLSVATMTYKTDGNGAADSSLANYKRLRTGDIAFEGHTSKSFRYGRFVLNDVGDGIMSPRFSALRPLAQMPTNFWKYYIHYEPIMRKILVASTKAGTMMNELVIDEFLKSSVLVPSIEEQTRIGSILKNIDNLITLHQRELEKLQNIKKSMLEKMFV